MKWWKYEKLIDVCCCFFPPPVHSYASVVWCFSLHGSFLFKRHPGNAQYDINVTQEHYRIIW